MKRFLILFLCFALLAGCRADPQTPSFRETEPTLSQEQPGGSLLDQGKDAGKSGNLLYIPNPHVEAMACPEICLFGNSLLLYEHTMNGKLHMKRISLEDGSLLAETSFSMNPSARVQVGSGLIGLCDSSSRKVLILNESLETEKTYSVPLEGGNWYLDQELETVYVFFDDGLMSYDLEADRAFLLLDDATFVRPFGVENGYALFYYTDRTDKKTYTRCLNLSTGSIESIPLDGGYSGVRSGERWLLQQRNIISREHILVVQGEAATFTLTEGLAQLLPGGGQLLTTDGNYRELTIYDLEGKFLSRCSLPEIEHASVGTNLVWSDDQKGYFFRDTYNNAAHLMFWNTDIAQEGEDLSLTPLGAVKAPEPVLEKEIYERAAELSQRFGLDIRIAEQCTLDYSHYQADALTDPYAVRDALNVLELAFCNYPAGFLRQLPFGEMHRICIELVVDLRGKEDMDSHPAEINGFAQNAFDHYLIVFDSRRLTTQTVYHEFSHVIDKHLEWDAAMRPEALFSETTWLSLQPEGFRYAYSYTDMPDGTAAYENSGYFISSYAMTFPTEDRATLMANIILDKRILQENPGMAEKMRYYAACIRDCFNTEGWPEETIWE